MERPTLRIFGRCDCEDCPFTFCVSKSKILKTLILIGKYSILQKTSSKNGDNSPEIMETFIISAACNQLILLAVPIVSFVMIATGMVVWPTSAVMRAVAYVREDGSMYYSLVEGRALVLAWASIFFFSSAFAHLGICASAISENSGAVQIAKRFKSKLKLSIFLLAASVFIGVFTVLIFTGGFIQGTLFPRMELRSYIDVVQIVKDPSMWAKLGVWSLLLGLYDRIFPSLTNRLVKNFDL